MNPKKIHPELRKLFSRIPPIPFHHPWMLNIFQLLGKCQRRRSSMLGVTIEDRQLNTAAVRIYRPEGALSGAGLLWMHGGGYIIGSTIISDRECATYARDLKMIVVSVEYRLAPKFPFPCALDDCFEAWLWFQDNADVLGVAQERIVISGQSAGGGLAAALAQRIADDGRIQPAGQALFCPMIDDRTAARDELDTVKHRLWNNKNNRGGWKFYLGQTPGLAQTPEYAVPARRENLASLAPAWIGVGDIDLFCEEDCRYAERLRAAGVECELIVVPGGPHAFETIVPNAPVSRDYMDSNYRFLRKVLEL